jgi:hypothetical protein
MANPAPNTRFLTLPETLDIRFGESSPGSGTQSYFGYSISFFLTKACRQLLGLPQQGARLHRIA